MKASTNLLLQSNDSVEGKHAAFEDVPCFLPVVPRITSCKPDLFQQIEYLPRDKCQLKRLFNKTMSI